MKIRLSSPMEGEVARRSDLAKRRLPSSLFSDFVSHYQRFKEHDPKVNPYVFVSQDGTIKYLTNLVDNFCGNEEIFALTMAHDGFIEFLTFQD